MLHKLFNPEWQITSKSFLLSSFLIGFSFSPTAEISRLELEFEESLPRKTASIFKEGIGQESNGTANQEKQIFLLCQISPSASSTRDLGTRLTERFKNVTSFVINLLNNKTIILLNLAEYRLITASSAKYRTIFRAISQDNC